MDGNYFTKFKTMTEERKTYASFDEYIDDCIAISFDRLNDGKTTSLVRTVKLGEEVGEFNEAMLVHNGFNQHKKLKEGIFGEGADIINCVIAALVAACPRSKPEEVVAELKSELYRKLARYKNRKVN
jgi:hypothetical protein